MCVYDTVIWLKKNEPSAAVHSNNGVFFFFFVFWRVLHSPFSTSDIMGIGAARRRDYVSPIVSRNAEKKKKHTCPPARAFVQIIWVSRVPRRPYIRRRRGTLDLLLYLLFGRSRMYSVVARTSIFFVFFFFFSSVLCVIKTLTAKPDCSGMRAV